MQFRDLRAPDDRAVGRSTARQLRVQKHCPNRQGAATHSPRGPGLRQATGRHEIEAMTYPAAYERNSLGKRAKSYDVPSSQPGRVQAIALRADPGQLTRSAAGGNGEAYLHRAHSDQPAAAGGGWLCRDAHQTEVKLPMYITP